MTGRDKKNEPPKDDAKPKPSPPKQAEDDEDDGYDGDIVAPRRDSPGDDDEPLE